MVTLSIQPFPKVSVAMSELVIITSRGPTKSFAVHFIRTFYFTPYINISRMYFHCYLGYHKYFSEYTKRTGA